MSNWIFSGCLNKKRKGNVRIPDKNWNHQPKRIMNEVLFVLERNTEERVEQKEKQSKPKPKPKPNRTDTSLNPTSRTAVEISIWLGPIDSHTGWSVSIDEINQKSLLNWFLPNWRIVSHTSRSLPFGSIRQRVNSLVCSLPPCNFRCLSSFSHYIFTTADNINNKHVLFSFWFLVSIKQQQRQQQNGKKPSENVCVLLRPVFSILEIDCFSICFRFQFFTFWEILNNQMNILSSSCSYRASDSYFPFLNQ